MPRRKKFTPMAEQNPEDWFSDLRKGHSLDIPFSVNMAIFNITKAAAFLDSSVGLSTYSNLVTQLEALISPYFDDKYKEEMKKIMAKKPRSFRELVPDENKRYKMLGFESDGIIAQEAMRVLKWREQMRFRAIMGLLDRKGQYFEHQTYEVIG